MSKLVWDAVGEHYYETGVDHGVLYVQNSSGAYPEGVAWNGLTAVNENPSGGDEQAIYADNIKYLSLRSAEEFGATIEAYTYPDEWAACDGSAEPVGGVLLAQQVRAKFGFCYRTKIGNDTNFDDYGYKLHLVYNASANPSSKNYETINDTPAAITFSWDITTTPVEVTGTSYKPTAHIVIDKSKLDNTGLGYLADLENVLYGIDAPEFSATSTYSVGDYVTHETKVYKCTTAITTAAAWDATKWTEVTKVGPYLPLPNEVLSIFNYSSSSPS